MSLRKKQIIIGVAILLIIGVFWFFKTKQSPILVNAIEIRNSSVEKTISASGIIKSENQADLSFASSGRITAIYVKNGNEVTRGQTLAQIYTIPQIQSAQGAKDARDIAMRNKDAYLESHKNDSQDFHNSDEFKIQIRKYDELISQAEASYRSASGLVENLYIKAPFSGTILNISKDIGEVATAGETIIKLANISNKYIEVDIDQEDFGKINTEQSVYIVLDAYPNKIFDGVVYDLPFVANSSTSGNNTFSVKIRVSEDDDNSLILIGMTGDVEIIVEKTLSNVNSIPFDAIYQDDDLTNYVWILENEKLKKQTVDVGVEGNLYYELIGIDSSTQIVVPTDLKTEPKEGMSAKLSNK